MSTITPAASDLEEASILLDGYKVLKKGTSEYDRFYINRPHIEKGLMREAMRGERTGRKFDWFFTGHTGSGKSTELYRIIKDESLISKYEPVVIRLESEFDIRNIQYTDLILAMGKACAAQAEAVGCPVSDNLKKEIGNWGAKFITVEETAKKTEGRAGLKWSLPFIRLSEEVRAGGTKREEIRKEITTNVSGFIRMTDELAETLFSHTGRRILCVLDGLDHVDVYPCLDLLYNHFETITLPAVSKLVVVPISLLNTDFLSIIEGNFSTVPNIKVFREPGVEETDLERNTDRNGFGFYKKVIERYVSPALFTRDALCSLFVLSAGIVRDMIRNTSDACGYAYDAGASRVDTEHVRQIWFDKRRFYRRQLKAEHYEVLRKVEENPLIKEIDGIPPLLHSKAVIFYPNGEGWYGVHPAIREIMRA